MSDISFKSRTKVISPCVGKCQLVESDICMGCYRLISEISGWLNKPESVKKEIVDRCTKRKIEHIQR